MSFLWWACVLCLNSSIESRSFWIFSRVSFTVVCLCKKKSSESLSNHYSQVQGKQLSTGWFWIIVVIFLYRSSWPTYPKSCNQGPHDVCFKVLAIFQSSSLNTSFGVNASNCFHRNGNGTFHTSIRSDWRLKALLMLHLSRPYSQRPLYPDFLSR